MQGYAVAALGGPRWQALATTMRFDGADLTGATFRLQVRLLANAPGAPLVDLQTVTSAAAEGVRLIGVETIDGRPVSTLGIRINETTMEGLPFTGEMGDSSLLAWDMQITPAGGLKRKWVGGDFIVEPGVTGADNAPAGLSSYGYQRAAMVAPAGSSTFQIVNATITVTLAGGEGPRGLASGPLGVGSVTSDTISDQAGEQMAIRTKLGARNALSGNDADQLQAIMALLAAGGAAKIDAYGDSTFWGANAANTNNQVATPTPVQIQNFVNTFHGNAALTVANRGISGTTLAQALAGTDGSGAPLAARLAATDAVAALFNFGVNDAFGPNATSAQTYRAGLVQAIQLCRAEGIVPILVTPFPCLAIGAFGSRARAEATAKFAQIMREVATGYAAVLVDNNALIAARFVKGASPLALLPDGVHAGEAGGYIVAGNNIAGALLDQGAPVFSAPGQMAGVSQAFVRATNANLQQDQGSRAGAVLTTAQASGETIRAVFRVDQPGLDITLGHLAYASGDGAVQASLDGFDLGSIYPIEQQRTGFGTKFWQDQELVIARDAAPGFHLLTLTTSAGGAATMSFLRSRRAARPRLAYAVATKGAQRALLSPGLETSTDATVIMDDLYVDWHYEALEVEFSAQLFKPSGLVIGGAIGGLGEAAAPWQQIILGCDGGGNVGVFQGIADSGTQFDFHPLSTGTDFTTVVHRARFRIAPDRTVTAWVDDVQLGATFVLTVKGRSGLLGVWKQAGGNAPLVLRDVTRIWRTN